MCTYIFFNKCKLLDSDIIYLLLFNLRLVYMGLSAYTRDHYSHGLSKWKRRYILTPSLIGWTPTQNNPWYTIYQSCLICRPLDRVQQTVTQGLNISSLGRKTIWPSLEVGRPALILYCHNDMTQLQPFSLWQSTFNKREALPWASSQISKIVGCACARNAGNVFPATAG